MNKHCPYCGAQMVFSDWKPCNFSTYTGQKEMEVRYVYCPHEFEHVTGLDFPHPRMKSPQYRKVNPTLFDRLFSFLTGEVYS